tara:strand:+ start:123 stop:758 length:636 start_codon:yes stop_codon:yes gene_type:complete
MINKNSILVGIAGGSGSGKTFLSKSIISNFKKSEIVLIEQDSYYKDLSHLSFEERSAYNFDHPNSLDYKLMKSQLEKMISGKEVNIPIYNYDTHLRSNKTKTISKHSILILDGIFALFDPYIREIMDIKIFVDTDNDLRIIRRIKRDMIKRNRTFESIIKQYIDTVRPMHIKYVEQTKKYADIIVPEGGKNKTTVDIISSKLKTLINNLKK